MTLPTNGKTASARQGASRRSARSRGFSKALKGVSTLALMASMTFGFAPSEVQAQENQTIVEFDGSKARVNLSGRLRMLTQKIASSACRLHSEYDVEASRRDLRVATLAFAEIIKGLREADKIIGIPTPEKKPRILSAIWALEQNWVKMKFASLKMQDGVRIGQYSNVIAELEPIMAEQTANLADEILAQYTNPAELLTGDALTINVAGRQRKLSQELSKNICGIASEQTSFGTEETFLKSSALFDKSLSALENGFPAAGVSAPPNGFIKGELAKARRVWSTAYAGGNLRGLDSQIVARKSEQLDDVLRQMDNVVTLYMLATPGQDDLYRVPVEEYANYELSNWLTQPEVIAAVIAQNNAHANLTQAQIDQLDLQWRAEVKSSDQPLVQKLLSSSLSKWLADKQANAAGLITEVFIMDNKGLNVAQSAATSDYWQGDEAKWKKTYGDKSGRIHISEVEFDDSTGSYQSQVSMPIRNPASGELIGAVTFGLNVQSFL